MCGIAGFYGFRNDALLENISKELKHRGPDGEGFYIDEDVSLLNRRLAIIDLKTGDQPIYNEDKSVVVVYNGEIYNYRALRDDLKEKGHIFKTNSDTEIIVHAYETWGVRCFDKFNGMFALALFDKKTKKLILARDHFGIKPLYYAFIEKTSLMFSSEIKPIIDSGLIQKKPNDRVIYRYLKYRTHDDTDETFFEGIYRLMPGSMIVLTPGKKETAKFTALEADLKSAKQKRYEKKDASAFKKKLFDAVRLRLISDVPVGTCLSGGLDSSTVVAIVNRLLKKKVEEAKSIGKKQNTFSAVFPKSSNNEEGYVDMLLAKLDGIEGHKIYPKAEKFFQELEDFIITQEEPTISTGPYAQYKVMQEAERYVRVVLDGQGSDEMLAGYDPYLFVYLRQLLKEKQYLKFAKELLSSFDISVKYLTEKMKRTLKLKKVIHPEQLLNEDFIRKYRLEKFTATGDDLKKRLIEDVFTNSLPSLLRYEDKNAMRFSIEGRVPFLDVNLLRLIFSLSDEAIIQSGWSKNILRNSVGSLVPHEIVKRRNKIGFTTPEHEWFMRMKNKIYEIFLSDTFLKRKYFNQKAVLAAFQAFIEGKNDDTMLFWRFLNLEIWLRTFFDKKVKKEKKEEQEFEPNEGKKLEIRVNGRIYKRFPIRTELFKKSDDYIKKINTNVSRFFHRSTFSVQSSRQWFLVVAEKIIAIAQGRSYFIWEIRPSILANILHRFVKKTPYGIGLGSPWTMQLAIQEAGLIRILFAALISAVTKPLGIQGLFYRIAGRDISAIDGPTEYSLYPSNVSAKLGPENPQKVAKDLHNTINSKFPVQGSTFQGVVIIDANDLGQDVLGNSTNISNEKIKKIFRDNPMGQADEQTPLVLVFQEDEK
ncbi:asparagine synthase (glutamine-hydrolyzing) [Candidatus Roizmanbacteria bacterium]|nr:asparagine synthase (glutamine-hydrolyzing) [Candidatus Roizmanbacteria bacterium]